MSYVNNHPHPIDHYDVWPIWYAHCQCGHSVKLDTVTLIDRLGAGYPMDRLRARMMCSKCGARGLPGVVVHCLSDGRPKG